MSIESVLVSTLLFIWVVVLIADMKMRYRENKAMIKALAEFKKELSQDGD